MYNQLDYCLARVSGIKSQQGKLIALLEDILPVDKAATLSTIRNNKNVNVSHTSSTGVEFPAEWVPFLKNLISYCNNAQNKVGEKIREADKKLKDQKNNVKNVKSGANAGNVKNTSPQSNDDMMIKCKQCGSEISFTKGEQEYYKLKGYCIPRYCKYCRDKRKQQKAQQEAATAGPQACSTCYFCKHYSEWCSGVSGYGFCNYKSEINDNDAPCEHWQKKVD